MTKNKRKRYLLLLLFCGMKRFSLILLLLSYDVYVYKVEKKEHQTKFFIDLLYLYIYKTFFSNNNKKKRTFSSSVTKRESITWKPGVHKTNIFLCLYIWMNNKKNHIYIQRKKGKFASQAIKHFNKSNVTPSSSFSYRIMMKKVQKMKWNILHTFWYEYKKDKRRKICSNNNNNK